MPSKGCVRAQQGVCSQGWGPARGVFPGMGPSKGWEPTPHPREHTPPCMGTHPSLGPIPENTPLAGPHPREHRDGPAWGGMGPVYGVCSQGWGQHGVGSKGWGQHGVCPWEHLISMLHVSQVFPGMHGV